MVIAAAISYLASGLSAEPEIMTRCRPTSAQRGVSALRPESAVQFAAAASESCRPFSLPSLPQRQQLPDGREVFVNGGIAQL
jgi:hypothetical protein